MLFNNMQFPNITNIKLRIGSLLFNIVLDNNFFEANNSFNVEKHKHSSYEIHFILKGSGTIKIENDDWCILPNSYYVIGPNIYHKQNITNNIPISRYSFRMDYTILNIQDDGYPIEESYRISEILHDISAFFSEDTENNISLIYKIHDEIFNQWIGFYSRIQTLFSQILINIIRDISLTKKANYKIPQMDSFEIRKSIIEDFFDYHYNDNNLTVEKLAQLLHISIRQLNRIINDIFNMSFEQMLLEKRMEISKNLLITTKLPVKTISEMVGYSEVSNFCISFKKKNFCTPSKYRQNNKIS